MIVDDCVLSKRTSPKLALTIAEWLLTNRLSSFSFGFGTQTGVPVFCNRSAC